MIFVVILGIAWVCYMVLKVIDVPASERKDLLVAPFAGAAVGTIIGATLSLELTNVEGFDVILGGYIGAWLGIPLWTIGLMIWQWRRCRRQTGYLNSLRSRSNRPRGVRLMAQFADDDALGGCLDGLEERMEVKYLPCEPTTADRATAFENWFEVSEDRPDCGAYFVVPMRSWLRKRSTTEGLVHLEPWNPFACVMITPSGDSGEEACAIGVSDHTFCTEVMGDLQMAEIVHSGRDPS